MCIFRCYVSVVLLDGIIYAMGGFDGHNRLRSAEKYDFERNQWTMIAPMTSQRSDACATVLNSKKIVLKSIIILMKPLARYFLKIINAEIVLQLLRYLGLHRMIYNTLRQLDRFSVNYSLFNFFTIISQNTNLNLKRTYMYCIILISNLTIVS